MVRMVLVDSCESLIKTVKDRTDSICVASRESSRRTRLVFPACDGQVSSQMVWAAALPFPTTHHSVPASVCKKSSHSKAVYPLYDGVNVIPTFDESDYGKSIPRLRKQLLDNNVDIFIPMLSEWLFEPIIEAAQGTGIPIVASEHNNPWKIEFRKTYFVKKNFIFILITNLRHFLTVS